MSHKFQSSARELLIRYISFPGYFASVSNSKKGLASLVSPLVALHSAGIQCITFDYYISGPAVLFVTAEYLHSPALPTLDYSETSDWQQGQIILPQRSNNTGDALTVVFTVNTTHMASEKAYTVAIDNIQASADRCIISEFQRLP